MKNQSAGKQIDWGLLIVVLALGGVGLLTLYSATAAQAPEPLITSLCARQALWLGIGFLLVGVCLIFNYKTLDVWAGGIYCLGLILLVAVLFGGKEAGGAQRWLPLGPVTIQPSEFAKLAVVVVLAKYYAQKASLEGLTLRSLVAPIGLTLLPVALIVAQPDLGTAMLIVFIAALMTVFAKVEKRTMIWLGGTVVVLVPVFWLFLFKDYQKQRILTFLDPQRDPLGAGYHIIQSKIAIGSGQIFGKGFRQGTQNALDFLPEQQTDFILSVLAEEWGFMGVSVVLALYLIILIWGISIAYQCRDEFGILLSVGLLSMIFCHVFINIGMVMGLMPVVGVPLPLISYGGSSVITFMIAIGILVNISRKRLGVE